MRRVGNMRIGGQSCHLVVPYGGMYSRLCRVSTRRVQFVAKGVALVTGIGDDVGARRTGNMCNAAMPIRYPNLIVVTPSL